MARGAAPELIASHWLGRLARPARSVVVTFTVTVAEAAPLRGTEDGEIEQVAIAGAPVQVNDTL